ncbi:hypothetical protein DV515_00004872 [Chloebia gouldiae]|uniref:Uncharacterized protein n=1 Tax=Chloebia gouldiae TaxID=44316 RepID=A0A3L8SQV7_CHLGU|nr:hypothetical protein DV515_00004872 [Chloebia gouldiae]
MWGCISDAEQRNKEGRNKQENVVKVEMVWEEMLCMYNMACSLCIQTEPSTTHKAHVRHLSANRSGLALRSRETKMPAGSAWCYRALLLLLSPVPLWAAELSCRNEDGEAVDW